MYSVRKAHSENSVQCNYCDQFYHLRCCVVQDVNIPIILTLIPFTGWTCQACRSDIKNEMSKLRQEIVSLCNQRSSNLSSVGAPNNPSSSDGGPTGASAPSPSQPTSVQNIVRRTINDISRRKRNVVVSGLPETKDGDDTKLFTNLCESHLSVKPLVVQV